MSPAALTADLVVEVRGATFSYEDGTRALTDVDFDVQRGEFVALLAANGCGKTTLLKLLIGLLCPQRGDVRLFGRPLGRRRERDLQGQVGLVLQNPRDQLFCAVVEDDVAYGPRNLGWSETVVQERVADALDAVRATGLRSRPIHRLSFGEQKRVAIAGVLAMNPLLLLVDEPTAGLDPRGELEVLSLLGRLNREQGITVVLATHSVDLLPLFADRLCLLRDGQTLKEGPVTDVFSDAEAIGHAHLRLPYVADLIDQLKRLDGIPIDGIPLTVAGARRSLAALLTPAQTSEAGNTSGGRLP